MGDMSSMMGGGGDFGGIDFSKLGGGESGDMDVDEDDDDDDDDEKMPELEGDTEDDKATSSEAGASAAKTDSKIEEL
jgi:hypothetical protein